MREAPIDGENCKGRSGVLWRTQAFEAVMLLPHRWVVNAWDERFEYCPACGKQRRRERKAGSDA